MRNVLDTQSTPTLVIQAGRTELHYWRDLWKYRELFFFLAWRDVLVRYKQTVIGVAWAILRPLLTMIAFTFVFGRLAKLPAEGVPYSLLVFAGLLPWQFFASAFSDAGNSVVGNSAIVSKVYFPRLIIPVSAVMVSLVDMLLSGVILMFMMIYFQVPITLNIIFLPLFIMLAFLSALGLGLWMAALNVRYRDFRYVIPFIVQFGLYVSPVGFSSSIIPENWRLLYSVNPMVGVIDGFRWALLGSGDLYMPGVYLSVIGVFVLLWGGVRYFRHTEKSFADVI
jgi:lipopolysaccharide transport system permease protein